MTLDERDTSETQDRQYQLLAKRAANALAKNNIKAEYVSGAAEALALVKEAIPDNATIGVGDSITLQQIGFIEWLLEQPNRVVFDPFVWDKNGAYVYKPAERLELMRNALTAGVFLSSSNAVTLDGKLVNIDGRGNRVAAMIFGPKKTLLVIGANKVVKDVDDALKRIRTVCAPLNNIRHIERHHLEFLKDLPCAVTGTCVECRVPMKVCRKIVIIDGQLELPGEGEPGIQVIMVGQSLGV